MKIPTHGDFFVWLADEERNYKRFWDDWTPEHWDPKGIKFDRQASSGFGDFIKAMADWSEIDVDDLINEFLEDIPGTPIADFIEECKKEAKKYFLFGWRKCILAGQISQFDEQCLTELFGLIKTWEGVAGTISFIYCRTNSVLDLNLEDVPDHIPPVPSKSFGKRGWIYKTPQLLKSVYGGNFWVRFENPEKIANPMVSFIDGVIMAIPEEMIPTEFDELATLTGKYLGQIKYKREV